MLVKIPLCYIVVPISEILDEHFMIGEYFANVPTLCENTIIFMGKFPMEKVNVKQNSYNGTLGSLSCRSNNITTIQSNHKTSQYYSWRIDIWSASLLL